MPGHDRVIETSSPVDGRVPDVPGFVHWRAAGLHNKRFVVILRASGIRRALNPEQE
jgi:hypothetical protein